jgi:hypothetical protein
MAATSNNITAEIPQADPYETVDILLRLLQDMWQKENFPKNGGKGF